MEATQKLLIKQDQHRRRPRIHDPLDAGPWWLGVPWEPVVAPSQPLQLIGALLLEVREDAKELMLPGDGPRWAESGDPLCLRAKLYPYRRVWEPTSGPLEQVLDRGSEIFPLPGGRLSGPSFVIAAAEKIRIEKQLLVLKVLARSDLGSVEP